MSQKRLPIVAIVGRPNVGKSSLFNRLVGARQAIVSEVAGTTRDPVSSVVGRGGKQFWLIDTAGMQRADSELDASVQSQIEEAIDSADLMIVVVAGDQEITTADRAAAKQALKSKVPVLLVVNKIDATGRNTPEYFVKLGIKTIIGISTIHGYGIDELFDALIGQLPAKQPQTTRVNLRLAIVGRPNVGKSSLFNKLLGEERAIVSHEPGTTRDVNRAALSYHKQPIEVLDTAGIRRPGKIAKDNIERFSLLRTARAIAESDVCVLVIDSAEPSVALDQKIAGMVKEAGRGMILATNKWDLIKLDESARLLLTSKLAQDFQFVWWAPVVYVSADSGHNLRKLIEQGLAIVGRRKQTFKTPVLNKFLTEAVANHPPSGLKNHHPKLKYVTQTDTDPPTFTFFGRDLGYLHWSYKRYLESRLRDQFDFNGTPIKLQFREE